MRSIEYYDAEAGRWTARDPKEQFLSSYVAFGNNPMKFVDPDGKMSRVAPILFGAFMMGQQVLFSPAAQQSMYTFSIYMTHTAAQPDFYYDCQELYSSVEEGSYIGAGISVGAIFAPGVMAKPLKGLIEVGGKTLKTGKEVIKKYGNKALTMDEALEAADEFLDLGTDITVKLERNGYRMVQEFTDEAGNKITKVAGIDVNKATKHVGVDEGSHLNLQLQVNGKARKGTSPYNDPHIEIDETTVRLGDY